MRKKKIKLTPEQKQIFEALEWYTTNRIKWVGEKDLKEVAQDDGWFAVFSIRGDPEEIKRKHGTTECYDVAILADTKDGAKAIMDFNPDTHALAINLKHFSLIEERRKPWAPMENVVYE